MESWHLILWISYPAIPIWRSYCPDTFLAAFSRETALFSSRLSQDFYSDSEVSQAFYKRKPPTYILSSNTYHWAIHIDVPLFLKVLRDSHIYQLRTTWQSFENWELLRKQLGIWDDLASRFIFSFPLLGDLICLWELLTVHTRWLLFVLETRYTRRGHLLCQWLLLLSLSYPQRGG